MTREDAKRYPLSKIQGMYLPTQVWEMVDKIFNGIENMTCENCVFLHTPELTENIYRCWEGVSTVEEVEIELNFSCNKWEACVK